MENSPIVYKIYIEILLSKLQRSVILVLYFILLSKKFPKCFRLSTQNQAFTPTGMICSKIIVIMTIYRLIKCTSVIIFIDTWSSTLKNYQLSFICVKSDIIVEKILYS